MTDIAPTIATLGELRMLPLSTLRLDSENPRLPDRMRGQSQTDLAIDMELGFQAYTVAESIASHGYFNSEPLIAIPTDDSNVYVVVEGNRRLTALLGLVTSDIRDQFAEAEAWKTLAARASIDPDILVPVVIAPDRKSVTPIIGFRHISGILGWTPYAQARYVAKLVDDDGMPFPEVAKMVGIDKTRVGNLYRDQAIAVQARDLGLDVTNLEQSFSLLTVAMATTALRNHIGAPLGSSVLPGARPIPPSRELELDELLEWIFGRGATPPVITESREIARLGNVVASPIGLQALRNDESLEQATQRVKDANDDPHGRLLKRLRAGRNALTAAMEDILDFRDDVEVADLVAEAQAAVEALDQAIDAGG